MNRTREHIMQTAMAGTERRPLPADFLASAGIQSSDDPAQTALDALAALHLIHKAAAPLENAPAILVPPCAADHRPLCPPDALHDLLFLFRQEIFAEALPEFFSCLIRSGRRLPPEALPPVLDYFARKRMRDPDMLAALRPAGPWLARQNPEWSGLYEQSADWQTGAFADRRRLLLETRRAHPAAGLALVEKTWEQERPGHKQAFLEILREDLSAADEPLLKRAASEKSRPLRLTAIRMLLQLPDTSLRRHLQPLLERLSKIPLRPGGLPEALEKILPGEGPFSVLALFALRSGKKTDSKAGAAGMLLRTAPAAALAAAAGYSPAQWLAALAEAPAEEWLEAGLEQIAWEKQPEWTAAALAFFTQRPQHPLWHSESMANMLNALSEAERERSLPAVAVHHTLLGAPDSALVQALLHAELPLPKGALKALLEYPLNASLPRHWQVPPHLRQLLQRGAFRCRTNDAEHLAQHIPGGELPYAWQSELGQFWNIVRFRHRMRQHLAG